MSEWGGYDLGDRVTTYYVAEDPVTRVCFAQSLGRGTVTRVDHEPTPGAPCGILWLQLDGGADARDPYAVHNPDWVRKLDVVERIGEVR